MNQNQINKIRMYQSTDLVLENFSSLLEQSAILKTKHQQLKELLLDIENYRQVQEQATSGLTLVKDEVCDDLKVLMLRTSAALVAYATSIGDADLKKRAAYAPSRLHRTADPVLYDIGTLLSKLAGPLIENLQPFFFDAAVLDALIAKLEEFKSVMPKNRVATSSRKSSTTNIRLMIREADHLLRDEIDALMLPFQFASPDFYQQYRNARIIIDYAGRKRPEPTMPEPGMPV